MTDTRRVISPERLETDIQMLNKWVNTEEIQPLVTALKALQQDPQNEARLAEAKQAFADLGLIQGAVLTYAIYLKALLSDDVFGGLQEEWPALDPDQ